MVHIFEWIDSQQSGSYISVDVIINISFEQVVQNGGMVQLVNVNHVLDAFVSHLGVVHYLVGIKLKRVLKLSYLAVFTCSNPEFDFSTLVVDHICFVERSVIVGFIEFIVPLVLNPHKLVFRSLDEIGCLLLRVFRVERFEYIKYLLLR